MTGGTLCPPLLYSGGLLQSRDLTPFRVFLPRALRIRPPNFQEALQLNQLSNQGLHRMHLAELKAKSPADLLSFAESLQVENASSLRKQDMMFAILKNLAENEQAIPGEGS